MQDSFASILNKKIRHNERNGFKNEQNAMKWD